jgi:hypothetical protein
MFSELDTFVKAAHAERRIMETTEMVIEALRLVAQRLGLPTSTPKASC